jgi:hypothetical protein
MSCGSWQTASRTKLFKGFSFVLLGHRYLSIFRHVLVLFAFCLVVFSLIQVSLSLCFTGIRRICTFIIDQAGPSPRPHIRIYII